MTGPELQRAVSVLHHACKTYQDEEAVISSINQLKNYLRRDGGDGDTSSGAGGGQAPSEPQPTGASGSSPPSLADVLQIADETGTTPLMICVQRGMAHAAAALLAAGAHPAVPRFTPSLNSALHVAAMRGDLACVRHLVAALCSPPAATPPVLDPGRIATATGPAGSAVPASGPRSPEKAPAEAPAGALPPLPGVAPGHPGSAVDLLSGNGSTPLLLACGMGHLGAAAALVKAGADPCRANDDGVTPLMAAASGGRPHLLHLLLRAVQATPQAAGGGTLGPQQQGAQQQQAPGAAHSRVAAALAAADCNGTTALHYAARKGCKECVLALLDAAAAETTEAAGTASSPPTSTDTPGVGQDAAGAGRGAACNNADEGAQDGGAAAVKPTAKDPHAAGKPGAEGRTAAAGSGVVSGGQTDTCAGGAEDGLESPSAQPLALALLRRRNAGGRDPLTEARLSGDKDCVEVIVARLKALGCNPAGEEGARGGPPGARQARGKAKQSRPPASSRTPGAGTDGDAGGAVAPGLDVQEGEGAEAAAADAGRQLDTMRGAARGRESEPVGRHGRGEGGASATAEEQHQLAGQTGQGAGSGAEGPGARESSVAVPTQSEACQEAKPRAEGGESRGPAGPHPRAEGPKRPGAAAGASSGVAAVSAITHAGAAGTAGDGAAPSKAIAAAAAAGASAAAAQPSAERAASQAPGGSAAPASAAAAARAAAASGAGLGSWREVVRRSGATQPRGTVPAAAAPAATASPPVAGKDGAAAYGRSAAIPAAAAVSKTPSRTSPAEQGGGRGGSEGTGSRQAGDVPAHAPAIAGGPVAAGVATAPPGFSGDYLGANTDGAAGAATGSASPAGMTATWEAEAAQLMQAALPAAADLELLPCHLCGLGLGGLSAAQLEGLEALHRAALGQIAEARLALAVGVEVARAEEERVRQSEIQHVLAAATTRGAGVNSVQHHSA